MINNSRITPPIAPKLPFYTIYHYKDLNPSYIVSPEREDNTRSVAIVDVETTGLDHGQDFIIELAIQVLEVSTSSGRVISLLDEYHSFNEPPILIPEEITEITGITQEMVEGELLDLPRVESIIEGADYLVAHNANFDKKFMGKYFPLTAFKRWGCSLNDLDWKEFGISSRDLTSVCLQHGFYFDSHRAIDDVRALSLLLSLPPHPSLLSPLSSDTPFQSYLGYLLREVNTPKYLIEAKNSPFHKKDKLKAKNYRWNAVSKTWEKKVKKDKLQEEEDFLISYVYDSVPHHIVTAL